MILFCVLLIVITLISIISGSIRVDNSINNPIIIHPEPKEKFELLKNDNIILTEKQEKLKQILSGKSKNYIDNRTVEEEEVPAKKTMKIAEGFQGYEYAMFA